MNNPRPTLQPKPGTAPIAKPVSTGPVDSVAKNDVSGDVRPAQGPSREELLARKAKKLEAERQKAANQIPDVKSLEIARQKVLKNKRKTRISSLLLFIILVVVSTATVAAYLFLYATPIYRAQAIFSVHTNNISRVKGASGLSGLIGGGLTGGLRDPFVVREYILSQALMIKMEKDHGFSSHFADKSIDFLSRNFTNRFFGFDEHYNYLRRVNVSVDVLEGILHVTVEGRTPQDAVRFSNAILKEAENHVNQMSKKAFDDQVREMNAHLLAAEKTLEAARRDIINLQLKHGELSPRETVASIYKSIQLQEEQLRSVELLRDVQIGSNLQGSSSVARLDNKIAAIKKQIEGLQARLVGKNNEKSLNSILAEFEFATVKKEIAQKRWELALSTLEDARTQALSQRRYLTIISAPVKPQFPEKSTRIRKVIFTFLASLVVFMSWSVFASAIGIRTKNH